MTHRIPGVWWVVISAATYSLFTVWGKGVLDDLRPTDVLFWRFALSVPMLWTFVLVRWRRGGPSPRRASIVPMLVLGLLFGGVALFAFAALDHLSASLYTVILYSYPAMVAIGAWLMGKPAPRTLWLAVGVTMLGIALTVPEVFTGGADSDGIGLLLVFGNAASYAIYMLVSSRVLDRRQAAAPSTPPDGIVPSLWSMTGSLAFAAVIGIFVGVRMPPDWGAFFSLVGLAAVSTVIAGATLMIGLTRVSAPNAAMVATLEPVLALVWAVLLLDESLGAVQVCGAALVLAGVIWSQRTAAQVGVAAEPG